MPVYEFICLKCTGKKKHFEVVRSAATYDAKKIKCPTCGSRKIERRWTNIFTALSRKS